MIRIQQLKVPVEHNTDTIKKKIRKTLNIKEEALDSFTIVKKSLDARKRDAIFYVYTVDVKTSNEEQILKRNHNPSVTLAKKISYYFPDSGETALKASPVIIGSGPCGLFCTYELALHGYRPILLERGSSVEERTQIVEEFWKTGTLNPGTNVQFGEGGAGTFSDGKLNTLVKDSFGRNAEVLNVFRAMGAPEEILYESKPHIGTDVLVSVLKNLRKEILSLGGKIQFDSCMTDLRTDEKGHISRIEINHEVWLDTEVLILAIGHSARDTFELLQKRNIHMEAKSFAVGMRVEHPQKMMNEDQYGGVHRNNLPAAPYKVTAKAENGRGVYSFCMCPGGYVVNASSEKERLAVNGMSYYKRDSENANSAIIVSVTPEDYPGEGPLAGMYFQRSLEEKAFSLGNGKIPQQLYGDYKKGIPSRSYGEFATCTRGATCLTDLTELFAPEIRAAFMDGMEAFGKKIHGFNREDAILSGVESRTSSPVRITRDEVFQCNIPGIYPAGEGAGYAGGIMSAAMDGIKVAEAIAKKYNR